MKSLSAGLLVSLLALSALGQGAKDNNTLLWKISGNGIDRPSFLFGTIHMLCKEDAWLSDNLKQAIGQSDRVYLELDMDNLFEMLGAVTKLKMKNDTTLADLVTPEEYARIKSYFESRNSMLPFSVLETYKPFIASSMLMEANMVCEEQIAMEQLIMEEARKNGKRVEGLETMAYQMSIFDSIPYQVQARELLKSISGDKQDAGSEKEFSEMMKAYKDQDLSKLGEIISRSDAGIMSYEDMLLHNRNRNWVDKLKILLPEKSMVIAVGAGHLPGDKGLISLLRKEGYKVTPVSNRQSKREIQP